MITQFTALMKTQTSMTTARTSRVMEMIPTIIGMKRLVSWQLSRRACSQTARLPPGSNVLHGMPSGQRVGLRWSMTVGLTCQCRHLLLEMIATPNCSSSGAPHTLVARCPVRWHRTCSRWRPYGQTHRSNLFQQPQGVQPRGIAAMEREEDPDSQFNGTVQSLGGGG